MLRFLLRQRPGRLVWITVSLAIIIGPLFLAAWPRVHALTLDSRSIAIGTSRPSMVTTHKFSFTIVSAGNLGSIELEYCTNDPFPGTPCTAPPGLNALNAVLDSQSGQTGFAIDPLTTANRLVLSRTVGPATTGPVTYDFSNITNPSIVNQSIYVRISTFASSDTNGAATDTGGVVFDLSNGLGVGGFVPPRLILCVGATVALDCSNEIHDIKSLGILSSKATGFTTTQFSVGTNDVAGYNVFVLGNTLTSGNDIITPSTTTKPSTIGTGQFGLNLVTNLIPTVGSNPIGAGTGTVASGYNSSNQYKFNSGDLVANSPNSTDFSLFTVSYIANIDQTQPQGIYSTTMTYLAIVAF